MTRRTQQAARQQRRWQVQRARAYQPSRCTVTTYTSTDPCLAGASGPATTFQAVPRVELQGRPGERLLW